jgi:hypothetical protein
MILTVSIENPLQAFAGVSFPRPPILLRRNGGNPEILADAFERWRHDVSLASYARA